MTLGDPDARFAAIVRKHQEAGDASLELALREMREEGANQIESIKALIHGAGLSLKDAKVLVDESQTWSDRRGATEALRDAAEAAVRTLEDRSQ